MSAGEDFKRRVERGYDLCGDRYTATREIHPPEELALLAAALEDGSEILEVGCGAGIPVTRALADRFRVTGVDLSAGQLERAARNIPGASFLHGDIMSMDLAASSYDAVVSFYAIFHLPREEHAELFRRFHTWLRPGGHLFLTLALEGDPLHVEENFFGTAMCWSFFGLPEYERMIEEAGFRILNKIILGHGFNDSWKGSEERHPLILARRS
jgi:cyclopropane fatty-acyl-phospholipid synthase-like methyltransferase